MKYQDYSFQIYQHQSLIIMAETSQSIQYLQGVTLSNLITSIDNLENASSTVQCKTTMSYMRLYVPPKASPPKEFIY